MAVTSQQVIDTYRFYLNRTPGTSEVNFWVDYSKANGAAQTNAAFLAGARSELENITRSAYQSTLGRTPSASEVDYWTNYALSSGIQQASAAFNAGAQEEIASRSPPPAASSFENLVNIQQLQANQPSLQANLDAMYAPGAFAEIEQYGGGGYRLESTYKELKKRLSGQLIPGGPTLNRDSDTTRAFGDSLKIISDNLNQIRSSYGLTEQQIDDAFEKAVRENNQISKDLPASYLDSLGWKINREKLIADTLKNALVPLNRYTLEIDNALKPFVAEGESFRSQRQQAFDAMEAERKKRGLQTAIGIASLFAIPFAPNIGAFIAPGASAATQAAIGGAVIGGGTAAVTGQDPIKGAVIGAIGSITTTTYATKVGNALGITSEVAARTVGNALINAGLSGVQAALTPGADVGKSMFAGAVTGAVSINATELARTLLGDNFIKQIEQITNLTANDVGNIFSNSIVQSLIAAINEQDAAQAFINTAISNGVSQSVANSMWKSFGDSFRGREDVLAGIVAAAKGVVDTGVNAELYNQNVKQAIENAAPGIIISSFRAYNVTADEMLKQQKAEEERQRTALKIQDPSLLLAGPVSPETLSQLEAMPLVGELIVGEEFIDDPDPDVGGRVVRTIQGIKNDGTPYSYEIATFESGNVLYSFVQNNDVVISETRPELKNAPVGTGDVFRGQEPVVIEIFGTADAGVGQLSQLPLTGLIDLRTAISNLLPTAQVVFSKSSGVVGRPSDKASTGFSFIGKDGSGRDRFQIGGINFTVISLDGKDVLVNDPFDVFLEPVIDPVTRKPELQPTPESEPFNPPEQTPAPQPEPTPERKPTTPTAPGDEGKTGAEGATGVAGGAPSGPSQAAPSLAPSPGAVVRPETTIPSVPGTTAPEITPTAPPTNVVTVVDAQNYFDKTKDQTGTKIILEVAAGTRPAEDAIRVLQQANLVPVESAVDRDAEIVILKEIEQQLEAERQAIERGRAERVERARVTRTEREQAQYEKEQAEFEKALEDLEADIAKARSDEEKAQARQIFTTQQRERLRETGRLTGGLQAQIDAELGNLLDQYEDAQIRAGRAVTQKEGLVAPQQPGDVGRGISDQDVIDFLGLGSEEAERYGFFGDTEGVAGGLGPGSGVEGEGPGSGGEGTGPGSGQTGVGPGAGDEGFGPGGGEEEIVTQLRPIVIYDQTGAPRPTQGIPQRVTAEAVAGILGDKEPLFGGDEDEQRAIWNRRSLRLRKALGL